MLAADIGGTKSRLAIVELTESGPVITQEQNYPSGDYSDLNKIVNAFLQTTDERPTVAGWSVAGPVVQRRCQITNLPWLIDADQLEKELGLSRSIILNDIEASAWGLSVLHDDQLTTLQPGVSPQPGNRAIIAAGTGLGEAGIYWDGTNLRPFATEGGHSDFAPTTPEQFELSQYLQKKLSHSTWEDVVSGPGLVNIFNFLMEQRGGDTPDWFMAAERDGEDIAAIIFNQADTQQETTAVEALELFVQLYAAEAGNLALKYLARDGLYIGGGIAPKILTWLQRPDFLQEFCNKGKMSELMKSIPVHVVMDERVALYGLALRFADS
jgi:glucokinase